MRATEFSPLIVTQSPPFAKATSCGGFGIRIFLTIEAEWGSIRDTSEKLCATQTEPPPTATPREPGSAGANGRPGTIWRNLTVFGT